MALITCPEVGCGRQVSDQAATCPSCGHPITSNSDAPPVRRARRVTPDELPAAPSWQSRVFSSAGGVAAWLAGLVVLAVVRVAVRGAAGQPQFGTKVSTLAVVLVLGAAGVLVVWARRGFAVGKFSLFESWSESSQRTKSIKMLRCLVVAEAVSGIIQLMLTVTVLEDVYARAFVERGIPPQALQKFVEADNTPPGVWGVGAAWLVATLACWVGLVLLKPWSRWLYLYLQVAGIGFGLVMGAHEVSFKWGVLEALGSAGDALSGVILAVVFLSPAASLFRDGPDVARGATSDAEPGAAADGGA